jgi:dTDP-4-dehydrorhamnose reductase
MVATTESGEIDMLLIVGASGQLGRSLQDILVQQNIPFIAASRSDLDISNQYATSQFLSANSFNTVVNCAAWTAVDDAEDYESEALRINFEGPRNLATAAKELGSRLIHISTDYVFSGEGNTPYTVTTPTSPLNAYGRTKLKGDEAVLEIGEGRFPVIRTAWLYSRYGKNFAKTMAARAIKGLPARVVDDQFGQPTMAGDVARFIVSVTNADTSPPIIHGTNSGQATWFNFAQAIYELLGADVSLVSPVTSAVFPTKAKRPSYSVLDHSELIDSSITEMREWLPALRDEIPHITQNVISEMK